MTDLTRPLRRATAAKAKDGAALVVKLTNSDVTILPKGTRTGRKITWAELYELLGAELDLEQQWITSVKLRGVPLVAKPTAFGVTVAEKGDGHGYTLPWMALYELGGKLKALEDLREKRHARGRK